MFRAPSRLAFVSVLATLTAPLLLGTSSAAASNANFCPSTARVYNCVPSYVLHDEDFALVRCSPPAEKVHLWRDMSVLKDPEEVWSFALPATAPSLVYKMWQDMLDFALISGLPLRICYETGAIDFAIGCVLHCRQPNGFALERTTIVP